MNAWLKKIQDRRARTKEEALERWEGLGQRESRAMS